MPNSVLDWTGTKLESLYIYADILCQKDDCGRTRLELDRLDSVDHLRGMVV